MELARALDPVVLWRDALGVEPDDWQIDVLRSQAPRLILNCCRQSGKTSTVGMKALHVALYKPRSLVLVLSRSLRQSSELGRVIFQAYRSLGGPVPSESETKLTLELSNGSRVICLPGGDEAGVRGFASVHTVIVDEASRCADELFIALRPMISVSKGRMILLSTPWGKRGFFWRIWSQARNWTKVQIAADQCPRLSPEFLAQEHDEIGELWYSQEYQCQFIESVNQIFSDESIERAFSYDYQPLLSFYPLKTSAVPPSVVDDANEPPLLPTEMFTNER